MVSTTNKTQRNASLDLLRMIACIMVVLSHVVSDNQYTLPVNSLSWIIIESFAPLGKIAACIFFMLSGFFSRADSMKKSIFKGIYYIVIFFVSAFFYSVLNIVLGNSSFTLSTILQGIWDFKYHLWFLTAFAGITMISPILNNISVKDLLPCTILMFVFCIFLPSLTFILPNSNAVKNIVSILNGVLSKTFVFIGYYLLGRFIKENKNRLSQYSRIALILFFLFYFVTVLTTVLLSIRNNSIYEESLGYNSIFIYILSVTLFVVFLGIDIPYSKMIAFFAPLSLWIYIIHVAFIDILSKLGITCISFGQGWIVLLGILIKFAIVYLLSTVFSLCAVRLKLFLKQKKILSR